MSDERTPKDQSGSQPPKPQDFQEFQDLDLRQPRGGDDVRGGRMYDDESPKETKK